MGALRTKLESFKQPKQPRAPGNVGAPQKFGPTGRSSNRGMVSDLKSAFWMARALNRDQAGQQGAMASADLLAAKREGRIGNLKDLSAQLDAMIQQVDTVSASLGDF